MADLDYESRVFRPHGRSGVLNYAPRRRWHWLRQFVRPWGIVLLCVAFVALLFLGFFLLREAAR